MSGPWFAHSANDDGRGVPELLRDHLQLVGKRCAEFAAAFGAGEQGYLAGLLHDLGKYADQFQARLNGAAIGGKDHWSVGACFLAAKFREEGLLPALAVAGHHVGLDLLPASAVRWAQDIAQQISHDEHQQQFTATDPKQLLQRMQADNLTIPQSCKGICCDRNHLAAAMLDVRMMFSCLVDADFLETEAHFNGDANCRRKPRPAGPQIDWQKALSALKAYLDRLRNQTKNHPIAPLRNEIFEACLQAADGDTGLYQLAAPTGFGKTLAMLAFAVRHAAKHHLRRIVLAMPFLNIIDQTAAVYRQIFSPQMGFPAETVIEDHSLARSTRGKTDGEIESGYDADLEQLLAENWDAPIILTTNVQLLESLMACRPGACRKLHRLAQSVIMFDEVQTIPPKLLVATLATLARLTDPNGPYRSTILVASATLPALDVLSDRVKQLSGNNWKARSIITNTSRYYEVAAKRIRTRWRHEEAIAPDQLADELAEHSQVLCIVNIKRQAAELAQLLQERCPGAVYHLSTNMCPAHRQQVIAEVTRRLQQDKPVRLVSTQCVEAGVDLDFPVVYRALAPLDALAQAAGRCNRHGTREQGEVVVFTLQDETGALPPGYRQPLQTTQTLLQHLADKAPLDDQPLLNNAAVTEQYYKLLFALTGRASSPQQDEKELIEAIQAGSFRDVDRLYKLIEQNTISILVPYDEDQFWHLLQLLEEQQRFTPSFVRWWLAQAQPFMVSTFRPRPESNIWAAIEPIQFSKRKQTAFDEATCYRATERLRYDALVGLWEPGEEAWIV